jgi:hypothetical protein
VDEEEPVPESVVGQSGPGTKPVDTNEVTASSTSDDQGPLEDNSPKRASRRLIIGSVVALVVVAAGIGLAFALSGTPTTISTGTGTATITWTPVSTPSDTDRSPPQPFEGTIEGITAYGLATMPLADGSPPSTLPSGAYSATLEVAQWKGSFGGKPFKVGIFAQYSSNESITNPSPAFPTVTITGRWGSQPVKGKVETPSAAEIKSGSGPLRFTGTVGQYKVSGTVQPPTGRKPRQSEVSLVVTQ